MRTTRFAVVNAAVLGLTAEVGFRADHFRAANGNSVLYIDLARP